MDQESKGTVCVTGGTGFVASWLIMRLLQRNYSVRATIRPNPNQDCKRDISYLTNLPGASDRLKILEADLDRPESFDSAIQGCTGVFHVAHPMDVKGREPEETVTKRAVDGTLGILRSCVRNSVTVKRVVYTSSAVTVLFNGGSGPADEDTWSDLEACRRMGRLVSPNYVVSKTVAEKTALEFAEIHGLNLVTLVLPLVVGPFVCPYVPSSVHMPLSILFGEYKNVAKFDMVHTDDVARAHIFLFECQNNVKGRYICSSADVTVHEWFDILSTKYPEFQLTLPDELKESNDKVNNKRVVSFKSEKLLSAGFKFKYGIDEMLDDAIQCCKDKGFISSADSASLIDIAL